ncbi:hypothetical protein CCP3SC1AL1_2330003 [Gammaproteobacteria bacterium]
MKKIIFLSCLLVACTPTEERIETAQGGVRLCADGARSYFGACPEDTHGYKPSSSPRVVLSPPAPERSRPPSGNRTDCNASRMPGGRLPPDCPPPTFSPQSTQLKDEEARLAEVKRQREELERTRIETEAQTEQTKLEAERRRIAEVKRQQEEAERIAKVQAETQAEQARLDAEKARLAELKNRNTATLIHGRYRDNGNGTVTDVVNKLRWKHCAQGQTWTGSVCAGEATKYTWNNLPKFSSGWRVPTIEEAKTLLYCRSTERWGESLTANRNSDWNKLSNSEKYVCGKDTYGTSDSLSIDKEAFVNTPLWIWTSTEYEKYAGNAWFVNFYNGYVGYHNKSSDSSAVRVVSSSQSPQSTQLKDEEELERTRIKAEAQAEQTKLDAERRRIAEVKRQQEKAERIAKAQARTQAEQARLEAERAHIAGIKRQQEEAKRLARTQAKTQVASTSTLIHGRYRDNGNGTVTDVVNKLRWKRCVEGQTWTGSTCVGEAKTYTWNTLPTFSGGWRVPTVEEANTLLYCRSTGSWNTLSTSEEYVCGKDIYNTSDNPAIDEEVFVNTPSWIWTSTYSPSAFYAWVVSFGNGGVYSYLKNNYYAVRVVSASQSPQSTQLKDEEELERTRIQAETQAEQARLEAESERIAEIKRQQEERKRLDISRVVSSIIKLLRTE